jgi:predicted Zn finger-like uncharacterized protein
MGDSFGQVRSAVIDSPMLIVCPSCATSYDVELASLQPHGRQVRCVRCRHVWHAEPSHAEKLLAAAEAIAPVPEMADAAESFAEGTASGELLGAQAGETIDGELDPVPEGTSLVPDAEAVAEIQVDSPSISPADLDESAPAIDVEAEQSEALPEDIETYAARHESAGKGWRLRWPLSALQSGVMVLLIVDAMLVGWRDEFVRMMPQTASFYSMLHLNVNLRGLAFEGVSTSTEQHEGVPILVVEGNIVNDSPKLVDVPRLKFAVRNGSGQEVYSWTAAAPRTSLPPGESVAFRGRLASPPVEAHDVLVRFLTRQDILAGAH